MPESDDPEYLERWSREKTKQIAAMDRLMFRLTLAFGWLAGLSIAATKGNYFLLAFSLGLTIIYCIALRRDDSGRVMISPTHSKP